jgi:hypothetical protein
MQWDYRPSHISSVNRSNSYLRRKEFSLELSKDLAIESLIHSNKLFANSTVLWATFVRRAMG